jgi:copper chaperone NosL
MKSASILMIIGSILPLGLFFLPMWNIELGAPQYPEPLGVDIYINGLQGQSEFDIQNIDGLNHYIGMKTLPKPEDMWEFSVFPKVVLGMSLLGILIGILHFAGKLKSYWFMVWLIVMGVLGTLGIYDFNLWLIDYGTNLDPNAILKLANPDGTPMSYKPPLIGHKALLNFDAYSYPRSGAYMMGAGMGLIFIAFLIGLKKPLKVGAAASMLVLPFLLMSCQPKAQPIAYGQQDCSFCKMTIVDKIHAAQLVTEKGKVYNYDAVECMLNANKEFNEADVAMYLVNHYANPAELIDATQATYLVSKELPSPMGGYLTAFATQAEADNALNEYGGSLHTFAEMVAKYK